MFFLLGETICCSIFLIGNGIYFIRSTANMSWNLANALLQCIKAFKSKQQKEPNKLFVIDPDNEDAPIYQAYTYPRTKDIILEEYVDEQQQSKQDYYYTF